MRVSTSCTSRRVSTETLQVSRALFGRSDLVRPGSFPRQGCTAILGCQLLNSRSSKAEAKRRAVRWSTCCTSRRVSTDTLESERECVCLYFSLSLSLCVCVCARMGVCVYVFVRVCERESERERVCV